MNEDGTNGIVIGVVSDLDDPDNLGRVRVTYPHLDDAESDWARTVNVMAGGDRGTFFRPERGDEVLVAWEHNDGRRPYILGALWSTAAAPPPDDGDAEANNWRFIRSRSGHVIRFDDTEGGEKIEIVDKDRKRSVVIDSSASRIRITCDEGIEIASSSGNVSITGTNISLEASGQLSLTASGEATLKGATVNLNPPGA